MSATTLPYKIVVASCGVTTHDLTDAARAHGISKSLLYAAVRANELPARFRHGGGKILVRCADVEAWIDRTTTPNGAEIARVA